MDGEPVPDEAAREKARVAGVFDRASATYDQVGIEFFGTVAAELVRRTAPQPGEAVLELGSGRGASVPATAEAVGPSGRVVATDLAPGMLDALRTLTADLPQVEVREADAEHPPPGPWDVVQAGLVLFFLPDLAGTLVRVHDELADGGRLGFTWFGEGDRSWDDITQVLRSLLPAAPEPEGADEEDRGPFSSIETMHTVLTARGFTDPTTSTIRVDVPFRDPAQWWDWIWSAGLRVLLERLDEHGALDRAHELVDPVLEQRLADGTLSWWTDMRCTVARR